MSTLTKEKTISFSTKEALNATNQLIINDGSRQTLGKGGMVTFTDLPNQPIALVAYNNTGNTTSYVVSYNNQAPHPFEIDSVQGQGFSLGSAFFLNPRVTGSREISVSVPNTAQSNASVDVYLVSLYLPTRDITNIEIPLNGKEMTFYGYSRAYATPPLAWYNLNITSTETGLVGFIFQDDKISTIAVNMAKEAIPVLNSKIFANIQETGIGKEETPTCMSGSSYSKSFYGTSSQIVYSPVSSARTTRNGEISIQKL